jgi:hypothetical protein
MRQTWSAMVARLTETEQAMQLEDLIKNFGVKQAESNAVDTGASK